MSDFKSCWGDDDEDLSDCYGLDYDSRVLDYDDDDDDDEADDDSAERRTA